MNHRTRATVVAAAVLTAVTSLPVSATAAEPGSPISVSETRLVPAAVADVAVARDGTVYVVGTALNDESLEHDGSGLGDDAFVVAVRPNGSVRDSRFLGGSAADGGTSVAVRADGRVVVAGQTYSDDFPTTAGTAGTGRKGNADAFVTVLKPDLSSVVTSTIVGGVNPDSAEGLAIDGKGWLWLTGRTDSPDLPVTDGPALGGDGDAFVAAFGPDLTTRPVTRVLGGTSLDQGMAVVGLPRGGAVVVGETSSADFPTVGAGLGGVNAYQGMADAWAARMTRSGAVSWASLFGGGGTDTPYDVALDPAGNAVVVGRTRSMTFPRTSDIPRPASDYEAGFALAISPAGDTLRRSTVLGGTTGVTQLHSVSVDEHGNAFVAGFTYATDAPTAHASGLAMAGDVYVAEVDRTGDVLRWAIPVGGLGNQRGYASALGRDGRLVVAGFEESSAGTKSLYSGGVRWLDSRPAVTGLARTGKASDRTPTFVFQTDVTGARTQCRVDGKPWKACTNGRFTTPRLSAGKHTVKVRATDLPGRYGPTASKGFVVR
ncbi:hypothetical protein [Nocardioides sp. SR21]|uniref:hypothetical protein n=1 Tax=Nocardioides sp. SR21 TaxID=2919501 RepID=UPI001FAAB055|nr:hypothetical protein [Nocardioides sp. SR21]